MTDYPKPEALDGHSLDIAGDKRRQLEALFPAAFTETRNAEGELVKSIDFERLKAELGTFSEVFESRKERFGLDWPGKAACMKVIQQPSTGTLLPMRDESVNFDSSENLIIEGDNLEVLKLLQKSYYGKVKMIYIDPPYNTGNEFIYPDNFREGLDEYLRYSGQVDGDGRKQSTNTETSGRYHSNWLSMMYPRLFLAKNLLRDDGVIFVSIDDNEMHNLRTLLNEIFGEENFLGCICWQKKYAPANDTVDFSPMHDFILVYARARRFTEAGKAEATLSKLTRTEEQNKLYKNPDSDPRGLWASDNYVCNKSAEQRPNLYYAIRHPKTGAEVWPSRTSVWRYSKDRHEENMREGRIWWGLEQENSIPRFKRFLSDVGGVIANTWWPHADVGHNDEGKKEIKDIFSSEELIFDTPKPTRLIKKLINLAMPSASDEPDDSVTPTNDIVLDFFAGSGTTGQAVIELNAQDQANRQFILVQLPQTTGSKDLKTIANITRERVKRTGKKLTANPGFRAFKLAASNFKVWSSDPAKVTDLGKSLQLFADHVTAGRTAEDILYELLLKAGYPLTARIEKLTLAGKEVFSVSEGALLICLDRRLTLEVIDAMVARMPAMILCLDDGFRGNDQLKVNAMQTVKSRNQNDETDIVFRVV